MLIFGVISPHPPLIIPEIGEGHRKGKTHSGGFGDGSRKARRRKAGPSAPHIAT